MNDNVIQMPGRVHVTPLQCNGVGRDADHDRALQYFFNRPVTDDEMRFLHECMKRAVALSPNSEVTR